jgi:hypothetical protein
MEAAHYEKEKKKWQIALRRYVLEKKPCVEYAPYFGIDIQGFRDWVSTQFEAGYNWDNFGSRWQFDHIAPMSYFNMEVERQCRLCWNFVNIRVGEPASAQRRSPEQLATYFRELFEKTGYSVCRDLSQHVENQTIKGGKLRQESLTFLSTNRSRLETLQGISAEYFYDLNKGASLENILTEISILNKYGKPSE